MKASREELESFKAELNKIGGVKVESLCLVDDANELNTCNTR
jgi:hypothetical protein